MATIFQQPNPTGFANCAVLASQENYYAPFLSSIGNWNSIRVSALVSMCGTGSFTGSIVTETMAANSANLGFYFGVGNFTSSIGLLTPYNSGCNFAGVVSYPSPFSFTYLTPSVGSTASIISYRTGPSTIGAGAINGTSYSVTAFNSSSFYVNLTGSIGSSGYGVLNTLCINIINQGQTGQQIALYLNTDISGGSNTPVYYSYTDPQPLRVSANNLTFSGQNNNNSILSYYTTGMVAGGGPLPLPDTVYFHSPFNNNFLRIHTLLVEKYA